MTGMGTTLASIGVFFFVAYTIITVGADIIESTIDGHRRNRAERDTKRTRQAAIAQSDSCGGIATIIPSDYKYGRDTVIACGTWRGGKEQLCRYHTQRMRIAYPQGWRFYPGDTTIDGEYVGGRRDGVLYRVKEREL